MYVFPEFAYSTQMQIILFFISGITTVITYLCITDLITIIYGQTVSYKRKIIFALVTALGLNQFWLYGIFALGNFQSFSSHQYVFIVNPNPVFAILYYWLGVHILKLSKYRSVRLMRMVYMYVFILRNLGEIIGVFYKNMDALNPRYNYFLDAASCITHTMIYVFIYLILAYSLKKNKFQIQLLDSLPIKNLTYELFISFLQGTVIYFLCTAMPTYFQDVLGRPLEGYLLAEIFVIYLLLATSLKQYEKTVQGAIENKDINMKVLMNIVDDFSGLKHDFFNMLQAYEGYIAIGDIKKLKSYHKTLENTTAYASEKLNLAHQAAENPEFTAVLIEMQKQAEKKRIHLSMEISCSIRDFYIPGVDLCSAISQLLSTAIQTTSAEKNIIFSIDQKNEHTKLIIINGLKEKEKYPNSWEYPKEERNLEELAAVKDVKKILYKYNNVFFHGTFSENNFFTYIELKKVEI